MGKRSTKGLVMVFTGDGKGKTTAAMGMAMRCAGHGLKCLMIQFIKGGWRYGELKAAKKLAPYFEMIPMGKGFIRTDRGGPDPEDLKAIRDAWSLFLEKMRTQNFQMIILDEINNVIQMGLLAPEALLGAVKEKPPEMHLVLTGRNAHPLIIEVADLVTEMREIKHPFSVGIRAQKGVEY
ncbi:MAG: cob(I)yrinic acid a,c-diamide adenosyltransferase [Deltaproteobacteria bacterium]|nr:cob(I)yrinic acid a,c-diamide adenosyltransferase [Deltaproteobacteria bacterium]